MRFFNPFGRVRSERSRETRPGESPSGTSPSLEETPDPPEYRIRVQHGRGGDVRWDATVVTSPEACGAFLARFPALLSAEVTPLGAARSVKS